MTAIRDVYVPVIVGLLLGIVLLVLLIMGLYGSIWQRMWGGMSSLPQRFSSNGEMIYFTGINMDGERIPFTGGPPWLSMRGGGCASCHGPDGQGGPVMMSREIAPDIRYEHLIEEEHDGEEEHPPYIDELIKRAITQGLDPAGRPLSPAMPRWHMSERDLNDVVEFLKTLK